MHICIVYNSFTHFQPPVCDANGENTLRRRRKRQTIEIDDSDGELYDPDREELRVKVYSGLYVNEATDLDDDLGRDDYADEIVSTKECRVAQICMASPLIVPCFNFLGFLYVCVRARCSNFLGGQFSNLNVGCSAFVLMKPTQRRRASVAREQMRSFLNPWHCESVTSALHTQLKY